MTESFQTSPSNSRKLRILHLEDSAADHQLVCRALRNTSFDFEIRRVDSLQDFSDEVRANSFNLILADYILPGFNALDAWELVREQPARPPFVILSGAIGESAAVSAIHCGISDYLHKDSLSGLERVIQRAMEVHQVRRDKELADIELAASERRLAGFAEHLQMAIEHERAAIAREIHDDIGGSLAAINLDLAWLARHQKDPATLTHISTALEMLQHAIGASQRIMMNLRPSILDQGLIPAIQWLATSFERRTGLATTWSINKEHFALTKPIELAAYRTVQEALTNTSKYANCTLVSIEVSDAEGVLTVEISDNGKGMHLSEAMKPGSFGLRGLKERARTVGGWLDISSHEARGTTIILSVPLSANPQQYEEGGL
jgi:signal transduction histidine kinase